MRGSKQLHSSLRNAVTNVTALTLICRSKSLKNYKISLNKINFEMAARLILDSRSRPIALRHFTIMVGLMMSYANN